MRPIGTELDGPAAESYSSPYSGPLPASEMSFLHALGPVQTWLGQELEKCGIDAMIYTRYVLSLLLHDSYDYDLQDQENDIFLGWEKGTGKKWGKGKKKGTDLSLEEMKKQAAVQCLRSASDESSGIETLVEELCSKLKDLQNKQKEEKKANNKSLGSQTREHAESPSSKDQVEMYYEAFPPLSEKTVCLHEIMTVWNKSKTCSYSSSSSSAAPQTSTDTSSPKDCNSEGETGNEKIVEVCSTLSDRTQQRRSKKEKENRHYNNMVDDRTDQSKKQMKHRCDGKLRPRSWSSGSSEAGSSSSGNQYEIKPPLKSIKIRHKTRDMGRNKKGQNGQVKLALKDAEKEQRRNTGGSSRSSGPTKQLCKKGKRPLKEIRKDFSCSEIKEFGFESRNKKEYREEPLWYTEPITEYFVPFSRKSKLETTYRKSLDSQDVLSAPANVEKLSESMQGICFANSSFQRTYLAAGTFVDGHFVEMPAVIDEADDVDGTSTCPQPEGSRALDDEHLSEFTHFYEVDIYQSILDTSASDSIQESRILSMIRQKSNEQRDFEAECCVMLDGLELQGESAIRADSHSSVGADGFFLQDLENIAQVWECCSSFSSEDIDGESFTGDSPVRPSPILDNTLFNESRFFGNQEEYFSEPNEGLNSSCFSLFEVQYDGSTLPFSCDSLTIGHENTDSNSCMDPLGNKQSRLLIWTKNSAFDETEHCSNLSTRTCSPWSHSEETRSDNETNVKESNVEESAHFNTEEINCIVPSISSKYLEDELLDFLHEDACQQKDDIISEVPDLTFKKKSKLESVCGIQLEKDESKPYDAADIFSEDPNQQNDNYSSGIIKGIWTSIGDGDSVATLEGEKTEDGLFPVEANYHCCLDIETATDTLQLPQKKAVQRSEYHLWEVQKEHLEEQTVIRGELSKVDGGDYTTPSKPWDMNPDKDHNTFILGGVYGELKTFNSDGDWAVVPPSHTRESLVQCAASDVVTIAGTDVFMNTGNCFAPGHKPLWRPLVSFGQCDQAIKGGDRLNKGFSFIFHEDLLGTCSNFQSDESGLDYSFSSFDLNNPFSQVLHVECSFEPEDIASFSPSFKPKSILCSDSESEAFHPRLYGINRTQYRAIRISPRTHFRPISASELSPGGGSDSEVESEKEELNLPVLPQSDVFEDPQADLKPLEEDAECEGPYYGKSELESGKFLPRLKKSGMEKSAQTSLDSQEGSSALLPIVEQEICNCDGETSVVSIHLEDYETEESSKENKEACKCSAAGHISSFGKTCEFTELHEFPSLNVPMKGNIGSQQEECWWQKSLCSPLFPGSQCDECCTKIKEIVGVTRYTDMKENPRNGEPVLQLNANASACNSNCFGEKNSGARATGFRRQLFSSDSSSSDETASENGSDWADPCEELFSRTHL